MDATLVRRRIPLCLLALSLAVCAIGGACSGGGDADQAVETDDGEVTIDTGDGEVTVSDDLPDDFPSELEYEPAELVGSLSGESDGQEGTVVTFETVDGQDEVRSWYESALEDNGWRIRSESTAGGFGTFVATKGDAAASVSINASDDTTTILITYGSTPRDIGNGD
jgi:hypothetical protein